MPRPLAILLALTFLIGAGWAVATPPLQGPDEGAHLGYAQHLAETGRAPSLEGTASADSREAVGARTIFNLGPLLRNVAARPAWSAADRRLWERHAGGFSHEERSTGSGPNSMAKNPPLYYAYESAPYWLFRWSDLLDRQLAMRLASVLLSVLTVGLTWLIAAELTPRAWVRFTAAGVVALQPQLAFISATINPDAMLAAASAAFVLAGVRLVGRGPSARRLIALAATAGLAAFTQGRGVALVPAAVVIAVVAVVRARLPLRGAATALAPAAATLGLLVVVSALLTGGAGGELRQNTAAAGFDVGQFASYVWQFYLPRLGFMQPALGPDFGWRELYVEGFFGTFGSLEVRFSPRTFDLLHAGAVAGLIALAAAMVIRRRELVRSWATVLALVTVVACVIALLHVAAYRDLLSAPADPLLVGRYLLPLVPILGLAVAFVCSSLPRRAGPTAAAGVLAAGVLLQLGSLGLEVTRFYG